MEYNYISLRVIADKILRHPLMAGISYEAIVDYAVDFMRIVQCAGFFTEKCIEIPIENYKGQLPDDYFEMIQVRGDNCTYRYATDSFHMSKNKQHTLYGGGHTYKIQGGFIFTSTKDKDIEISYQAMMVDDYGFPMIPDNSKFTRALELYIKLQYFTILFDMGKIQPAIFQNVQQEYCWAVGACEGEFKKMSLDKSESFYNSWREGVVRDNEYSRGFLQTGAKQNLKME